MSLNKVIRLASAIQEKYIIDADWDQHNAMLKKSAFGGHGGGSIGSGSAYRGSVSGKESELEKIKEFALITIPEFEAFIKNIVPALRQMEKEFNKAVKLSDKGQNDLEGIAIMNNIPWRRGLLIPEALESVMLQSIMKVDPVKSYFTKIASERSSAFIAAKIALANRHLSFFERLKDKAKSIFNKKPDVDMETESESVFSPGLDIQLELNKVSDLKDKLENIMKYIEKYIASYKSFYEYPTIEKLHYLIDESTGFDYYYSFVKSDIKQLQNLVNPTENLTDLWFESDTSLDGKSVVTSILSYLMRDPNLNDPNNVKRALRLYHILENKLRDLGAL